MDFVVSIRPSVICIAVWVSLMFHPLCVADEAPRFVDPVGETNSGNLKLRWTLKSESLQPSARFELEQAQTASFDPRLLISTGIEASRYVTGLREGNHFFRVRNIAESGEPGPWSSVIEVSVKYVDSQIVWTLMGAGLLTFAMTVGGIFIGQRRARKLSRA